MSLTFKTVQDVNNLNRDMAKLFEGRESDAYRTNRELLVKADGLASLGSGFAKEFGQSIAAQALRYHTGRNGGKVFQVSPKQAALIQNLWAQLEANAAHWATALAPPAGFDVELAEIAGEDLDPELNEIEYEDGTTELTRRRAAQGK